LSSAAIKGLQKLEPSHPANLVRVFYLPCNRLEAGTAHRAIFANTRLAQHRRAVLAF
jgi:hypothetical protein